MGHRLANHAGNCRNLHGHQYVLEVVIEGVIDQEKNSSSKGMVADFGDIKEVLQNRVQNICDHAFMVAEDDIVMRDFFKENPDLKHVIVPFDSTAENIAQWIFTNIKGEIEKLKRASLYSVQLWETPFNWALIEKDKLKTTA
jgi:6-pyruvoyltetrahydropterin/6-carboxytetrahydropterin synthase